MLSRRLPALSATRRLTTATIPTLAAAMPLFARRFCNSQHKPSTGGIGHSDVDNTTSTTLDLLCERIDLLERVVTNLVANAEAQQMVTSAAAAAAGLQQPVPALEEADGEGEQQQQQRSLLQSAVAAQQQQQQYQPVSVTDVNHQEYQQHYRNVVSPAALRAVIKVYASVIAPNALQPWQVKPLTSATGTAFVVDKQRRMLLTNCHVVAYASLIEVRRHGEARRFVAECKFISGDCDLALLEVQDNDFWEDDTVQAPPFFSDPNGAIIQSKIQKKNSNSSKKSGSGNKNSNNNATLEAIAQIGAFEGFPTLQQSVNVVGYPLGGDQISITSGVVSRVEQTPFSTSGLRLASIQIDAAINPGNSGGPALCAGKVVGVAFQSLIKAEGIGYLIPNSVIARFIASFLNHEKQQQQEKEEQQNQQQVTLTSTVEGFHEGFPLVGIYFQELANPSLRDYYRVPAAANGFLVEKLTGRSPNANVLKPGDIIMKVDGMQIERDITIEWRRGERIPFTHVVHMCEPGVEMQVTLWREGREQTLPVRTEIPDALVRAHLLHPRFANKQLPFTIYNGCVFTVLTIPYLESWGQNWGSSAPRSLVNHFLYGEQTEELGELVVLSQILPHAVNRGYSSDSFAHRVVKSVNGKSVKDFADFLEQMRVAANTISDNNDDTNSSASQHVVLTLQDGNFPLTLVLPKKEAREADTYLCKTHGIPLERAIVAQK